MSAVLLFLISILFFCFYMLIRNLLVHNEHVRMIEFYYSSTISDGKFVRQFNNEVPSYESMLFKFWIYPISSFYPSYHNQRLNQDAN